VSKLSEYVDGRESLTAMEASDAIYAVRDGVSKNVKPNKFLAKPVYAEPYGFLRVGGRVAQEVADMLHDPDAFTLLASDNFAGFTGNPSGRWLPVGHRWRARGGLSTWAVAGGYATCAAVSGSDDGYLLTEIGNMPVDCSVDAVIPASGTFSGGLVLAHASVYPEYNDSGNHVKVILAGNNGSGTVTVTQTINSTPTEIGSDTFAGSGVRTLRARILGAPSTSAITVWLDGSQIIADDLAGMNSGEQTQCGLTNYLTDGEGPPLPLGNFSCRTNETDILQSQYPGVEMANWQDYDEMRGVIHGYTGDYFGEGWLLRLAINNINIFHSNFLVPMVYDENWLLEWSIIKLPAIAGGTPLRTWTRVTYWDGSRVGCITRDYPSPLFSESPLLVDPSTYVSLKLLSANASGPEQQAAQQRFRYTTDFIPAN
jgi:hypothetical protein